MLPATGSGESADANYLRSDPSSVGQLNLISAGGLIVSPHVGNDLVYLPVIIYVTKHFGLVPVDPMGSR
jgi:hypothetical protein